MTGAVTTKYENEYTVKHKTSSFSYKYWSPIYLERYLGRQVKESDFFLTLFYVKNYITDNEILEGFFH